MKSKWLAATVCVAGLLNGCSSFNRQWKAAVREPIPTNGIAGPWEGEWVSEASGHSDKLRCVVTQESADAYQAAFHANYKKVFHFGYTVPLQVREEEGLYRFSGEADLGKLAGGRYTYEGRANGTNFYSTYNSKYDHGRFEMTRPK